MPVEALIAVCAEAGRELGAAYCAYGDNSGTFGSETRLGRLGAKRAITPLTELSDLPPEMRARRYLELAEEARRSAAACRGELREHYLFLAVQWEKLAADVTDYFEKRQPDSD